MRMRCIFKVSKLKFFFAGLLLYTAMSARNVLAQNQQAQPYVPTAERWMTEAWSGNDKPFLRQQNYIEHLLKSQGTSSKATTQMKKTFVPKRNAISLHAWAYAAYQDVKRTQQKNLTELTEIMQAMEQVPSPRTYSYARLRFLISCLVRPLPRLRGIGERLLKRRANDVDVQYNLINVYNLQDAEERKKALKYSADLIANTPRKPNVHASAGWTYFRLWLVTKQRNDAEKALKHYRDYLALAPQNDPFRARAKSIMKILQSGS